MVALALLLAICLWGCEDSSGDSVGGEGAPDTEVTAGIPTAARDGGRPWGMPSTPTPIGLPGPAHLPMGGPAGLQSYTIKNNTRTEIHDPVKHFRVNVKHEPGIRLPKPVSEVYYTEKHPSFAPGLLSRPAWAAPGQ